MIEVRGIDQVLRRARGHPRFSLQHRARARSSASSASTAPASRRRSRCSAACSCRRPARCEIDGFDVAAQPHEVRKRIGFLPDTPPLYDEMSVGDYLAFVAQLRGVGRPSSAARARSRGEDGAASTCTTSVIEHAVARLSAARRRGAGAGAQPAAAHPRRADLRPRPGADRRDAASSSAICAGSTPSCCRATSCRRSARPVTACWSSTRASSSRRDRSRSWPRTWPSPSTSRSSASSTPPRKRLSAVAGVTQVDVVRAEGTPQLRVHAAADAAAAAGARAGPGQRRRALRIDRGAVQWSQIFMKLTQTRTA